MREYLMFLPFIFIFHDMEEIVGFGWFFRRNPWLYKRFPKVMKNYIGFTETGMAIGVYEELLVFGGALHCSHRSHSLYSKIHSQLHHQRHKFTRKRDPSLQSCQDDDLGCVDDRSDSCFNSSDDRQFLHSARSHAQSKR